MWVMVSRDTLKGRQINPRDLKLLTRRNKIFFPLSIVVKILESFTSSDLEMIQLKQTELKLLVFD